MGWELHQESCQLLAYRLEVEILSHHRPLHRSPLRHPQGRETLQCAHRLQGPPHSYCRQLQHGRDSIWEIIRLGEDRR